MSDQSDNNTDYVIKHKRKMPDQSSDDLATEEKVSSRTRSKLSNNCGSPKISTPIKIRNANRTMDSDKVKKSNLRRRSNRLGGLEEEFSAFKYKQDSRKEVVEWLHNNKDFNKNVIYINSESITAEKLYDLCDKEIWLSSDHINAYLSYLSTKFHCVFSLPSFFYTKLTETGRYEYSSVVRWTKRTEIFKKEIIFVPIIMDESHWILATIFMRDPCRIAVLDSLGVLTDGNAITIGKNLIRWLNDEYRHKRNVDEDQRESYKVKNEDPDSNKTNQSTTIGGVDFIDLNDDVKCFTLDIMFRKQKPPQVDGCSCGVFVCMFARLMAENIERDTIIDIAKLPEANNKFRKVMCTDLWEYAKENKQVNGEICEENIFS